MPFWCDGSVRLLCGQNVNDSMWAIVGNEKLRMALATGVTFSSLKSCTVSKTAKPGGSSTSLWSQNPHSFGWENTLVSISGGSGIRPSCSSCLIKPKSNGYKRDVVNTSIELQLFEVINSYYFLCNLFSSYGGLWNWTLYAFVVLEVHVTKKSDTEKSKSNRTAASSNGKYYCWLCCSPQLVSPRCFEKLFAKRPLGKYMSCHQSGDFAVL